MSTSNAAMLVLRHSSDSTDIGTAWISVSCSRPLRECLVQFVLSSLQLVTFRGRSLSCWRSLSRVSAAWILSSSGFAPSRCFLACSSWAGREVYIFDSGSANIFDISAIVAVHSDCSLSEADSALVSWASGDLEVAFFCSRVDRHCGVPRLL